MKRLFLLIVILPFLLISCRSLSNDLDTSNSKTNSDSFAYSSISEEKQFSENQPLYNRIILDYYEQIIMNPETLGRNICSHNNQSINVSSNPVPLDSISLEYLFLKFDEMTYFVGLFDDVNFRTGLYDSGYQVIYILSIEGEEFYYGSNCPPLIWHQGSILYIEEAYNQNIVSLDAISKCFECRINKDEVYMNLYDNEKKDGVHYDEKCPTLSF